MSKIYTSNSDEILIKVMDYIEQTQLIVLGTVSEDGKPTLRTLGSFVNHQLDIYFLPEGNLRKLSTLRRTLQ